MEFYDPTGGGRGGPRSVHMIEGYDPKTKQWMTIDTAGDPVEAAQILKRFKQERGGKVGAKERRLLAGQQRRAERQAAKARLQEWAKRKPYGLSEQQIMALKNDLNLLDIDLEDL